MGYVCVVLLRVLVDFEGGDSEAAVFEYFFRYDAELEKKIEVRRNIFVDFEK